MPFATPLESDLFGFIAGLPMHPLVVHAAVVLLPLSAIALILIVCIPKWRKHFGWLTIVGLVVGTGAVFVAKESGEALAAKVGLPADHALWGDILVPVSVALVVVAVIWLLLAKRAARSGSRSVLAMVTGAISAVLAVAAIAITVVVGHSGAQAVWAGEVVTQPSATTSVTATGYTMADVSAHATAADCWTAIDKTVYNLTDWAGRHPGGEQSIVGMCGTDGTSAFKAQHGSQKKPVAALVEFAIGNLTGAGTPTASASPSASQTAMASASPTAGASGQGYTLAQVKQHASASSCWSAVDGKVYDLTRWIGRHPGGQKRIVQMCGQDGTAAFRGEHGTERGPNNDLNNYLIGSLAGA